MQSTERAWYNWGETGLCMPHVTDAWTPRVFFRRAPALATHLLRRGRALARGCAATPPVAPPCFALHGVQGRKRVFHTAQSRCRQ